MVLSSTFKASFGYFLFALFMAFLIPFPFRSQRNTSLSYRSSSFVRSPIISFAVFKYCSRKSMVSFPTCYAANGELTSVAVLLREPPGFHEKPRFSRRLVKRLVRFYVKIYPYFLSQRTIFKCNSNMDGALKVCSFGGIVPTKGIIPSNFTTISIGFFPESLILMMEI